jgi:hypothetical protein
MTVDLLRRLLETHPNLYLAMKVQDEGFQAENPELMSNRIVDENWEIRPEWLDLIGDYPDRFMIGSDEFIDPSGRVARGPSSFSQTWSILDLLPPELARQVGHDNAVRVYNLD